MICNEKHATHRARRKGEQHDAILTLGEGKPLLDGRQLNRP
jgi:hypothetical protein